MLLRGLRSVKVGLLIYEEVGAFGSFRGLPLFLWITIPFDEDESGIFVSDFMVPHHAPFSDDDKMPVGQVGPKRFPVHPIEGDLLVGLLHSFFLILRTASAHRQVSHIIALSSFREVDAPFL